MDHSDVDDVSSGDSGSRWSVLGLAGVGSLCCIVAPTISVASGVTAASGATAAIGGGLVQILVTALTVGAIGLAVRYRTDRSCER
jgi:precorrin-3B methylase